MNCQATAKSIIMKLPMFFKEDSGRLILKKQKFNFIFEEKDGCAIILLPNIWGIDSKTEHVKALYSANQAMLQTNYAKIVVTGNTVNVMIEFPVNHDMLNNVEILMDEEIKAANVFKQYMLN